MLTESTKSNYPFTPCKIGKKKKNEQPDKLCFKFKTPKKKAQMLKNIKAYLQ